MSESKSAVRTNRRRVLKCQVVSMKMEKTIKVLFTRQFRHPRYEKVVHARSTFLAHNELSDINVGDYVNILECRPLSKHKRWTVISKTESK